MNEVRRLMAAWQREPVYVSKKNDLQAHVRWVSGYEDIEGNDAADALAKQGCSSAASLVAPRTMLMSLVKRWRKLQLTRQHSVGAQQQTTQRVAAPPRQAGVRQGMRLYVTG